MESDRKVLTVHSALVVHDSKRLDILVSDRSEAERRYALLAYVDERTFVRLNQHAYTGDYIAVDQDILLDFSATASHLLRTPAYSLSTPSTTSLNLPRPG